MIGKVHGGSFGDRHPAGMLLPGHSFKNCSRTSTAFDKGRSSVDNKLRDRTQRIQVPGRWVDYYFRDCDLI